MYTQSKSIIISRLKLFYKTINKKAGTPRAYLWKSHKGFFDSLYCYYIDHFIQSKKQLTQYQSHETLPKLQTRTKRLLQYADIHSRSTLKNQRQRAIDIGLILEERTVKNGRNTLFIILNPIFLLDIKEDVFRLHLEDFVDRVLAFQNNENKALSTDTPGVAVLKAMQLIDLKTISLEENFSTPKYNPKEIIQQLVDLKAISLEGNFSTPKVIIKQKNLAAKAAPMPKRTARERWEKARKGPENKRQFSVADPCDVEHMAKSFWISAKGKLYANWVFTQKQENQIINLLVMVYFNCYQLFYPLNVWKRKHDDLCEMLDIAERRLQRYDSNFKMPSPGYYFANPIGPPHSHKKQFRFKNVEHFWEENHRQKEWRAMEKAFLNWHLGKKPEHNKTFLELSNHWQQRIGALNHPQYLRNYLNFVNNLYNPKSMYYLEPKAKKILKNDAKKMVKKYGKQT